MKEIAHWFSHFCGAFGDFMTIRIPMSGDGKGRVYLELSLELLASENTLLTVDRFLIASNNLCLEKSSASLPPVEIQATVSEVEAEGTHAENAAQNHLR
jgi:hypothetical protein